MKVGSLRCSDMLYSTWMNKSTLYFEAHFRILTTSKNFPVIFQMTIKGFGDLLGLLIKSDLRLQKFRKIQKQGGENNRSLQIEGYLFIIFYTICLWTRNLFVLRFQFRYFLLQSIYGSHLPVCILEKKWSLFGRVWATFGTKFKMIPYKQKTFSCTVFWVESEYVITFCVE